MEIGCSVGINIIGKVQEKDDIYGPLIRKFEIQYQRYTFSFISIIIRTTEYILTHIWNLGKKILILNSYTTYNDDIWDYKNPQQLFTIYLKDDEQNNILPFTTLLSSRRPVKIYFKLNRKRERERGGGERKGAVLLVMCRLYLGKSVCRTNCWTVETGVLFYSFFI